LKYLSRLKCVITAGGIGTRLLPFSKEIPKEMCPLIVRDRDGACVKPIIQAIFEQLNDYGIRDFFIVVGRGKVAIQEHFTRDESFLEYLRQKGKVNAGLENFYRRLSSSNVTFVVQPEPKGFGDAVLRARPYVHGSFLVHAGDTLIISNQNGHLRRLAKAFMQEDAEAALILQKVDDPRSYGVAVGHGDDVIRISHVEEKPERPKSNLAIMPVYIFRQSIFQALKELKPGKGGEIQLTDAIQRLIEDGSKVIGIKLREDELRLDIGSPQTLIEALRLSSERLLSHEPFHKAGSGAARIGVQELQGAKGACNRGGRFSGKLARRGIV